MEAWYRNPMRRVDDQDLSNREAGTVDVETKVNESRSARGNVNVNVNVNVKMTWKEKEKYGTGSLSAEVEEVRFKQGSKREVARRKLAGYFSMLATSRRKRAGGQ